MPGLSGPKRSELGNQGRRSEPAAQSHPDGPSVGVDEQPVGECGESLLPDGRHRDLVLAQSADGPGLRGRVAMPIVESGRAGRDYIEELVRVDEVCVVTVGPSQVLADQFESQVARVGSGAVAEARRVQGCPIVALLVDDGRGQLRIMGPGAAIEVVRSHRGPHVVDDADLRVHVHRYAPVVFDVEYQYAITAGRTDDPERRRVPQQRRRNGQVAVVVEVLGNHHHQPQVRLAPQSRSEHASDVDRPQILILDVDELGGPVEGFGVRAGRAALAFRGERVGGASAGIGAQQLHRARALLLRGCRGRRELRRFARHAAQHVRYRVPR